MPYLCCNCFLWSFLLDDAPFLLLGVASQSKIHVLGSLGLQDLTQQEKSQHTQRLTGAMEKLKQNSSKTPQDQAQAAAAQRGRKKMDASNQTADLASHSLWSRKYQPSNMSEVISQHSWLWVESQSQADSGLQDVLPGIPAHDPNVVPKHINRLTSFRWPLR